MVSEFAIVIAGTVPFGSNHSARRDQSPWDFYTKNLRNSYCVRSRKYGEFKNEILSWHFAEMT